MRTKIAIGVGLVAVVLAVVGPPMAALCLRQRDPPLWLGMDSSEVERRLGPYCMAESGRITRDGRTFHDKSRDYVSGPDWLGNSHIVVVHFDSEGKVTGWGRLRVPRSRPPWLDRALKTLGW